MGAENTLTTGVARRLLEGRPHLIPATIAALMLLAAVGDWPYGYYQLLRFIICAAGAYVAWLSYHSKELLSNVVDEIFGRTHLLPRWVTRSGAAARRTSIFSSTQPPKPDWWRAWSLGGVPGLPSIWFRLGGDEIERSSPKATPLGLSCGL